MIRDPGRAVYDGVMRRAALGAIVLGLGLGLGAGCGQVATEADARPEEDAEPGPIDALSCTPAETICDGSCVDTLSDEQHCGDCTTSCGPTQGCLTGLCVDATASCAIIRALDPTAGNGVYTHEADGAQFFCDMTHGAITYEELAFAQHDAPHPGYQMAGVSDLNDPVIQAAFVWLYNHGGGATNLTPGWVSTNCCFKGADTGLNVLALGDSIVFPAQLGADVINCNGPYNDLKYRFWIATPNLYAPVPLPDNFFQTYPASSQANCSNEQNPAFFFRRHN